MSDLENLFDAHTHHFDSKSRSILQWTKLLAGNLPPYFSVGIHPKESRVDSDEIKQLFEQFKQNKRFLAVGEIGLDNRYDSVETQEEAYIIQLEIASKLHKPVILHCVNSWDRCRFLHEKHAPNTSLIYHGFNKASIVEQVLNYPKSMISIGESLFSNQKLQNALRQIPLERLFLETDMGSGELIDTYQMVAEIKNVSLHALTELLNQNAKRIFKYE